MIILSYIKLRIKHFFSFLLLMNVLNIVNIIDEIISE